MLLNVLPFLKSTSKTTVNTLQNDYLHFADEGILFQRLTDLLTVLHVTGGANEPSSLTLSPVLFEQASVILEVLTADPFELGGGSRLPQSFMLAPLAHCSCRTWPLCLLDRRSLTW